MKVFAAIVGALLGALFLFASVVYLFDIEIEQPQPPEGSPQAQFMGVLFPTGYLTLVKICELVGAVLVAIPATRTIGVLVLTPIVVNIFAYHYYLPETPELTEPMLLATFGLTVLVLLLELPKLIGLIGAPKSKSSGKPKKD